MGKTGDDFMIIKNGNFSEVFQQIALKNVFIYGAGKNARELFDNYQESLKKIHIISMIDNNCCKQKTGFMVDEYVYPVISEKEFLEMATNLNETIILLTIGDFWGVLDSLESNVSLKGLTCYLYPLIKLEEQDKGVYDVVIPVNTLKSDGEFYIPPVIHYCWFGGAPLPKLAQECIESWKKYCPNYEIKLWNEENYDISKNSYMLSAYKEKKWAFVADYARVDIINECGGIYLDTDVEIMRSFDILRREKAFSGFESGKYVSFGLGFGSVANNPILCDLLKLYDELPWDGGRVACPIYQTKILEDHGMIRKNFFQKLDNMTILPVRYMSPISVNSGRKHYNTDAFSIHHFVGSWLEGRTKQWAELKRLAVYEGH